MAYDLLGASELLMKEENDSSKLDFNNIKKRIEKWNDYRNNIAGGKTKADFSFVVEQYRCELVSKHDNNIHVLHWSDVAKSLKLRSDILTKAISGRQKIAKRDFVIALCYVLRMNAVDTSVALYLYDKSLLNYNDDRDKIIISHLNNNVDNVGGGEDFCKESTDKLDNILLAENYERLIFGKRRNNKKLAYKTFEQEFDKGISYESCFDGYNSLETEYDPRKYKAFASITIYNSDESSIYELSVNKYYCFENNKSLYSYKRRDIHNEHYDITKYEYESVINNDKQVFKPFYDMLQFEIRKLVSNNIRCLADTRNYKERYGARMINGKLHVFAETFNYYFPELNEYYLVEKVDDIYFYYVSKQSIFMWKNLRPELYKQFYSDIDGGVYKVYKCLDDVDEEDGFYLYSLKKERQSILVKLKSVVDDTFEKIINKEIYIRNFDYIYGGEEDKIIKFFGVENKYNLKYVATEDEDGSEFNVHGSSIDKSVISKNVFGSMIPFYDNTAEFVYENKSIIISIDVLVRAFELGASTIDEVLNCVCFGKRYFNPGVK